MHRVVLQKVMKGKIEPLDEWLAKGEMALQQQPLAAGAAAEEEKPAVKREAKPADPLVFLGSQGPIV